MAESFVVHHGDCREVLRGFPDCSVDSIVTDPPYELGFMGKTWDATGIAYDAAVWVECLRVLKPGGYLLAFGGSRTYHRMACAIEDAGFEIRDQIMWVYGSGFPKSLDVSKAIDKGMAGTRDRALRFTEWMRSTGITAQQINDATDTNMASHYLTDKTQPAIATADLFDLLRPYLPEVPEEIERLVAERTGIEWTAYKNRPITGKHEEWQNRTNYAMNSADGLRRDIPATSEAQQWQGWGTALKPAHEPIVVARKPVTGTVAANVLAHGTGALNIDGCRIGTEQTVTTMKDLSQAHGNKFGAGGIEYPKLGEKLNPPGRWPANVVHDGSDEVATLFGDAARFFYCAKASKSDRNEGLEGFEAKVGGSMTGAEYREGKATNHPIRANHHPTVKPTELMRYLVRLITPPSGTVLDPFTGSGSTGKAAMLEGFAFVDVEQDVEYVEIARARIRFGLMNAANDLFEGV